MAANEDDTGQGKGQGQTSHNSKVKMKMATKWGANQDGKKYGVSNHGEWSSMAMNHGEGHTGCCDGTSGNNGGTLLLIFFIKFFILINCLLNSKPSPCNEQKIKNMIIYWTTTVYTMYQTISTY